MNKKPAFTMVELIFVIVILGILAAVAVPRLNASRVDAEAAKLAANLATLYKDVQNYHLANGDIFSDSNLVLNDVNGSKYANLELLTNVPLAKRGIVSFALQVGGKNCLEVSLYESTDYDGYFYRLYRYAEFENANALCLPVLKHASLKPLISGWTGLNWQDRPPVNLAEEDVDRYGLCSVFRSLQNRKKEGIKWD